MPVTFNGQRHLAARPRGNRGKGFDLEIAQLANLILEGQRVGCVAPNEVAAFLNGIKGHQRNGKRFTASSVRRMLARGVELGFAFHRQSRAEAGSRPRQPRRTQHQIEQDMRAKALAARTRREIARLNDVAIISASRLDEVCRF